MKRVCVLLLVVLCFLAHAQKLTLLFPQSADHFHQKDTIIVRYSADSTYMNSGIASGVVIALSVRYLPFMTLHPMNLNLGNNTEMLDDSLWGRVPIIIPDSIQIASAVPPYMVSTASDSIRIKVRDYGHPSIKTDSISISIAPVAAPGGVVRKTIGMNRADNSIRIFHGTLRSVIPLRRVRLFTLDGTCIEKSAVADAMTFTFSKNLKESAYIVECMTSDDTRQTAVFSSLK